MGSCDQRQAFLSGFLSEGERDDFLAHVKTCDACREHVSGTQGRKPNPVFLWAGIAAAALLFVGVVGFYALTIAESIPEDGAALESPMEAKDKTPIHIIVNDGAKIRVSGEGRNLAVKNAGRLLISTENDSIGLNSQSAALLTSADIADTQITLTKGTIVIRAKTRSSEQSLRVFARGHTIQVTGTEFLVSLAGEAPTVAVRTGKVTVTGPDGDIRSVGAGQSLRTGPGQQRPSGLSGQQKDAFATLLSTSRAKAKSALPALLDTGAEVELPTPIGNGETAVRTGAHFNMDAMRQRVLNGEYSLAIQSLCAYLRENPQDVGAWTLLADCHRKTLNWAGALDAYGNVVRHGSPNDANRARYNAGSLCQDKLENQREAARWFQAYLQAPGDQTPLEAEAMMRLAIALEKTGRHEQSVITLKRIINEHKGTTAAVQAGKMRNE